MAPTGGHFGTERELQCGLLQNGLGLFQDHDTVYVRREVPVGGCIPDLVYVRLSSAPNPHLWPRKWTFHHAYIVWLLRRSPGLTPEAVAERCFAPLSGRIGSVIEELAASGALRLLETGGLVLSEEMGKSSGDVIAVEAKLRRWRRALSQAESYLRFADTAIVAMDSSHVPRGASALARYKHSGIGLCAVSRQEIEWLVRPRRASSAPTPDREYLIASAVARQSLWSSL